MLLGREGGLCVCWCIVGLSYMLLPEFMVLSGASCLNLLVLDVLYDDILLFFLLLFVVAIIYEEQRNKKNKHETKAKFDATQHKDNLVNNL